jgi:hypothetical protein
VASTAPATHTHTLLYLFATQKLWIVHTYKHCWQTVCKEVSSSFGPCLQTVRKKKFGVSCFPLETESKIQCLQVWTCFQTWHQSTVSHRQDKCSECGQARIRWSVIFCNQSFVATLKIRLVLFWQNFWSQLHLRLSNLPKDYLHISFLLWESA